MAKTVRQTHDGAARELEDPVTDLDQQSEISKGSRYEAPELGYGK